jgi:quercetin dioxygenase-like cupin family protein
VLDGDLWLELDDGQLTRLGPGDTVVQNGTRHAWRNLSANPATVAVVQVGAERTG